MSGARPEADPRFTFHTSRFTVLGNCLILIDPGREQRVRHREYHRTDKEPDDAEGEHPPEYPDNDQ